MATGSSGVRSGRDAEARWKGYLPYMGGHRQFNRTSRISISPDFRRNFEQMVSEFIARRVKPHVSPLLRKRNPHAIPGVDLWKLKVVSCSNGTFASRHFLSLLLRLRQPQPRNRTSREEHRPRARLPLLIRRPHRTQRLHLTRRPRRTSPRHGLPRRSPRPTCPRSTQRRGSLPGPPAGPRPWRDPRRRREPLRLPLKSADGAAALARELRNRASSKIWRSPDRAALPLRHRPGAAAATPRHNKTWLRNWV